VKSVFEEGDKEDEVKQLKAKRIKILRVRRGLFTTAPSCFCLK
jgi:hypothetical protein